MIVELFAVVASARAAIGGARGCGGAGDDDVVVAVAAAADGDNDVVNVFPILASDAARDGEY